MKPIFLIGYMGSGKSTLGRLVSAATGLPFIDLDTYIENRFHKSVRDIFQELGEDGFRKIERAMLEEVSSMEDVLIACGGGTPCFFNNMDVINGSGTSVLLEASLSVLHSRLKRGRHKRPLIAQLSDDELLEFIKKGVEARSPHYTRAKYRFNTSLLESETDREDTARRFIEQFNLKCPK